MQPETIRTAGVLERLLRLYLQPPPRVDVAEWAAQYRYIAKGPERGRWRNERTPYLVEPMQCASSHTPFERVALMFATQMGKSELIYNAMMQRIHTDPQDMMMVQPTLQDAQEHSALRFLPTILQTPIMTGLVAVKRSRHESTSWRSRTMRGGFAIFFAGANSASSLASKPLGFAVADEVDKWPADVDNNGPPLGLLEERMSNFGNRKLLICSTPGIYQHSVIESEYLKSDKRQYHVPCSHCGERQVLVWGSEDGHGLKWLKTAGGHARPETAVYMCQFCGAANEERFKTDALANGIWMPQAPGANGGRRAGFHLNKLYSPLGWRSWSALVEEFETATEKSRIGDKSPLKKFKQSTLAETWKDDGTGGDADLLRQRAEPYEMGIVPHGGLMLTMGIDVQPDRLECRVWAFGRGEESWLVQRHIIYGDPNFDEGTEGSPWSDVNEVRRTSLRHASGTRLLIEATCIDTGGHNTHAVYHYCRAHQRSAVLAIKGHNMPGRPVIGRPSEVDVTWKGKTAPKSLKLWMLGVDTAKDLLFGRMKMGRVGPGYMHVPDFLVETDEFEQMTAPKLMDAVVNHKQVKRWITPPGHRDEASDCMVYAYAGACFLGIQTYTDESWSRRAEKVRPVKRVDEKMPQEVVTLGRQGVRLEQFARFQPVHPSRN
jgi:phage terminase large subunit GpA-like protein